MLKFEPGQIERENADRIRKIIDLKFYYGTPKEKEAAFDLVLKQAIL